MAKAIPQPKSRQAVLPHSEVHGRSLGPTFLTPDCGYSVVQGLLYCHAVEDCWLPGDPLLLGFDADYRPLVRNIRRCRRRLLSELRRTISPRRKRMIRVQRHVLDESLVFFEPLAETFVSADDSAGG